MMRTRLLGEELVVASLGEGRYACFAEHCAHRGCSLRYGFLEDDGVRCAYHGWKFDFGGQCVEQPFEPTGTRYRDRIRIAAYPVQALCGILFVYMGPSPAPLLPRWDVLVRRDGWRRVWTRVLDCNWFQIQENTVDTTHTHFLHARTLREKGFPGGDRARAQVAYYERPIIRYDFKPCAWGIEKTCLYGGEHPGEEIRPPLIFPNILRIGDGVRDDILQWRVPVDDEHTRLIAMTFLPTRGMDADPVSEIRVVRIIGPEEGRDEDGDYDMLTFPTQDMMAWETQGRIADRTAEHLGASDRGIVMLRRMLAEQIEIVERGGDPMALLRDEADNEIIRFEYPRAEHAYGFGGG